MAAIQISRAVRLAAEERFASNFNGELALNCTEFGLPLELIPEFNFSEAPELPQNFYRGSWELEDLARFQQPEWPVLAMWVGEGQDQSTQKPRSFSGVVAVYWRFFLLVRGLRRSGLVDLREAVEGAMVATLAPEGLNYRGDLSWGQLVEQSILSEDKEHVGWLQEVTFTASFEVDV